jgi:hypothetical protein
VRALGWALLTAALVSIGSCSRKRDLGARASTFSLSPSPREASGGTDAVYAGPLREADVIFQTSRSAQSQAIQIATHSRFSHVGLVHIEHGKPFVYEAVGPVKLTPAGEWIARGEGKHYTVMRLKDADARLLPDALRKMEQVGRRFGGRPYDFSFGWSDERLYCSELVWKIYKEGIGVELGSLQRLGDFDLTNPLVQAKLRERYGARVPLEEPVISPGAIAASTRLETVLEE